MGYLVSKFPLIEKTNISKNCFSFWIHCPEIAASALPGQFCHVKANGFSLRRPISICEIDKTSGNLRIVFEIRGEGTAVIAETQIGETVDLIAPLGKGFTLLKSGSHAIAVGGGIGTPPMLEVMKHYGKNGISILGFRSKDAVILEQDFTHFSSETVLCTDDGTAGQKGFVTTALEDKLKSDKPDIVYACGPKVMLKNVAKLCDYYHVRCEVSLEERMSCGIGACLGCACKCVKNGQEFYAHVCKDGPVFDAKEVVWDE